MKYLVLFFLVGCASSASLYDALDDVNGEHDLLLGQDGPLFLNEEWEIDDDDLYADEDNDIDEEMKDSMREEFIKFLQETREHIESGKEITREIIDKLKLLVKWLVDWNVSINEKIKEMARKIKEETINDELKDILHKLISGQQEGTIQDKDNLKEKFQELKDFIEKKHDKEATIKKIAELFGKDSVLDEILNLTITANEDNWEQKLLEGINAYLKFRQTRSLKEYWEKVKNYFKDLHIDLKEKYFKFGQYVKENFGKILDKGKDKLENIKAIAKEFIDHTKGVSKDVAAEALEFLKQYKEDLGGLWDKLKEAVKDIINKKD